MPGDLATIAFEQAERAGIVRIEGEIDMSNADRLLKELRTRIGADPWLIVDLSGCSYVDSAGLSVIAQIDGRCREAGSGLRLVVDRESGVERVLTMTRLDEILNIDRTLEEAIESAAHESPDADRLT
jgi:anti-anti-sigma factor